MRVYASLCVNILKFVVKCQLYHNKYIYIGIDYFIFVLQSC